MNTDWKILMKNEAAAQFPLLYATLNPNGEIVINRSAFERMGSPEAFIVMFDPLRHRLGLKAAGPDDQHGYPPRKYGNSGARKIRARRMLEEFNVHPAETVEFTEAKIDDGILILDLHNARVSARAHSQCRRPQRPMRMESPFPFVK